MQDSTFSTSVRALADERSEELVSEQLASRPLSALQGLFTGDHLNASGGFHYSDKNFGRDSAISMLFLLDSLKYTTDDQTRSKICYIIEKGIKSLVQWQGNKDSKIDNHWRKNAEEKGKIHHEVGRIDIDELGLAKKWRDAEDSKSDMIVYFGSVDSTPLFVRLVGEYIAELKRQDRSGRLAYEFLLSEVGNFRGNRLTIASSVREAVGWIERRLDCSDLGFIEYSRRPGQEEGLRNQVWKDSLTSYVHTSGELANTEQPIASIEVQALAYDALVVAAEMFKTDPILANAAKVTMEIISTWQTEAQDLRQRIFQRFWIAPAQRFAQAIDRDPVDNSPRRIEVASSNELHLLNSRLFDDMEDEDKRGYIQSLVGQTMSDEFLTEVGIRCRARSLHNLINFTDYHGSWAVWPWESHWIALGLRHQKLNELADEIDKRIINAFGLSNDYSEFYMVNPSSQTTYYRFVSLETARAEGVKGHMIVATNLPDAPQTWSAAAAIDIRALLTHPSTEQINESDWAKYLQERLMKHVRATRMLKSDELEQLRHGLPAAIVDLRGGKIADEHYYQIADKLKLRRPALAFA